MKHLKGYKLFEKFKLDKEIVDPTTNVKFKEWFGDSKVVDKSGEPLVMYHGTRHKFDTFEWSHFGQTDDGFYGRGFYFDPDPEEAKDYGPLVMAVYLKVENPFWLKVDGSMGSAILLDVRDDLAKLPGLERLKTNRELPEGYYVKQREDTHRGDPIVNVSVSPKKELYGTDKEIYGPGQKYLVNDEDLTNGSAEIQAIVAFNDELADNNFDSGWTSQLLKKIDRNKFTDRLTEAGYDGLFVVGATKLGQEVGIEDIREIVIFNDGQIKSATDNSGNFDPKSNNIFEQD